MTINLNIVEKLKNIKEEAEVAGMMIRPSTRKEIKKKEVRDMITEVSHL